MREKLVGVIRNLLCAQYHAGVTPNIRRPAREIPMRFVDSFWHHTVSRRRALGSMCVCVRVCVWVGVCVFASPVSYIAAASASAASSWPESSLTNVLADELFNVVEIAGFCNGVVMSAIWKFLPDFDLGLAHAVQPLHMRWSTSTSQRNQEFRAQIYSRHNFVLKSAEEEDRYLTKLRQYVFGRPHLMTERR